MQIFCTLLKLSYLYCKNVFTLRFIRACSYLTTLSHSLLYLHTFVYLPATEVPPATTPQQTTDAGSPTNTAITTSANERSINTSSGRSKVCCYCFGSDWSNSALLTVDEKLQLCKSSLVAGIVAGR